MTAETTSASLDERFLNPAESANPAEEVEACYVEQHAALYRVLVASGCAPEEAPDLIQEAFVRLFQQLRKGRRIETPRNWLIRVMQYLWYNQVRRRKKELSLDLAPECFDIRCSATDTEDPEWQLHQRQRMERLEQASSQLTPTQRRYLLLRSEGMKFREIAELHGVSTATVAEACAKALTRLREMVGD